MLPPEGVVKFEQRFTLAEPMDYMCLKELNSWRKMFHLTKVIGQSTEKYGGVAYGNVSQRIETYNRQPNKRQFIITGTQTGEIPDLGPEHYTTVLEYYPELNTIVSEGPIEASSESMTHGTVYDLVDSARFVFHIHCPEIWNCAELLGIPVTDKKAEYGTPEMAKEVRRLFRETDVKTRKVFAMGGHQDGIVTFDSTSQGAGLLMIEYLAKSLQIL